MEGWVKIYRKLMEWEWYKDSLSVHLFIHLLLSASVEERKWRGITIHRVELVTSVAEISKKTGLSSKNIRTRLEHFERCGIIGKLNGKEIGKNATIVTICNFDSYQSKSSKGGKSVGKQIGEPLANPYAKEGKEEREELINNTNNPRYILQDRAPAREDASAPWSFSQLSEKEQAEERALFFRVFYFAGAKDVSGEVKRFIEHNERYGWRTMADANGVRMVFETREQRVALARRWTQDARFRGGREQQDALQLWEKVFDAAMKVRPDLASKFLNPLNAVEADQERKELVVYAPDPVSRFLESEGAAIMQQLIRPEWTVVYKNKPKKR